MIEIIETVTEDHPHWRQPEKKSCISQLFEPPFLELMVAAPNNLMVRGNIMRLIGVLPPDSANTYELLCDWIETNVAPKTIPSVASNSRRGGDAFSVDIDFSETEIGRARYSVCNSGSDSFMFTVEELDELIHQALADDDSFDVLLAQVKKLLSDNIHNRTDPNMSGDEYVYSNHSADNTESSDWNMGARHELRDKLRNYIRDHHPESAQRLLG